MKHKFSLMWRVAVALVLVLSFSLVMAVPAAAQTEPSYASYSLETRGDGEAEWSTDKVKEDFGSYSAKVTIPKDEAYLHHGVVQVPYGEALSTITDANLSFCFYTAATPSDVILFGQLYIDSGGGNVVDKILMSDCAGIVPGGAVWTTSGFAAADSWRVVDYNLVTGEMTEIMPDTHGTLAEQQAKFPDATLIYAAAGACGYDEDHSEAAVYIDDICIDGETHYDLEPIVLDAEYYDTGDTVTATMYNGEGSGTYAGWAYSDTVGDANPITFSITESATAGVFTGSFDLVSATPGTGELLVNDGDTVQVKCRSNWGAGLQTVDWGPSAAVDVPPAITSPEITYPAGATAAIPSDEVTVSATVTDEQGVATVILSAASQIFDEMDETAFTVAMTQVGTTDVYDADLTVADVNVGAYPLTITATDTLDAFTIDKTLSLEVRITTVEVELYEGWNLISLPLIPDDSDITKVISDDTLASGDVSSVGSVRGYDPVAEAFSLYEPGVGGPLTDMEDGYGYWVFMDTADTLTVSGKVMPDPPATPPTYPVVEDWNLIGFKSVTDMTDYVAEDGESGYLLNIAGTYPVLWSYDALAGAYSNVKGEPDGMEVGHGFWLWAEEEGTIVPPR